MYKNICIFNMYKSMYCVANWRFCCTIKSFACPPNPNAWPNGVSGSGWCGGQWREFRIVNKQSKRNS